MQKNKLEGMKPFNEFFFRSCYYHQLISALSCFGIEKDNILLNTFASVHENFTVEWKEVVEENQTRKILEILNDCKDLEEAKEKVKALLNK